MEILLTLDNFVGPKLSFELRSIRREIMYLYNDFVKHVLRAPNKKIDISSTDPAWLPSPLIVRALKAYRREAILLLAIASTLISLSPHEVRKTEISISHSLTVTLKQ